jgi:hypothetical protein
MVACTISDRAAPFTGLTAAAIAASSAGAALSLAEGTNRYNRARPPTSRHQVIPILSCRDIQGIGCRMKYGAPQ